jgi:hypothetical protein
MEFISGHSLAKEPQRRATKRSEKPSNSLGAGKELRCKPAKE